MITNLAAIIAALVLTESGGNPASVGDNNKAVGVLQMWEIQVHEVNRILGRRVYTISDRKDPEKSKDMCGVFLTYWSPRRKASSPEEIANLWRNPTGKKVLWYQRRFLSHYKGTNYATAND